jgi:hypothetical protein
VLTHQEKRRYYLAFSLALRAAVVNDSGVQRGPTAALVGVASPLARCGRRIIGTTRKVAVGTFIGGRR